MNLNFFNKSIIKKEEEESFKFYLKNANEADNIPEEVRVFLLDDKNNIITTAIENFINNTVLLLIGSTDKIKITANQEDAKDFIIKYLKKSSSDVIFHVLSGMSFKIFHTITFLYKSTGEEYDTDRIFDKVLNDDVLPIFKQYMPE